MGYQYLTQYDAACYTPGRPYGIDSITIHWWDDPAKHPTFDGVVNTFVTGARQTSAHYVAEAGKVACLVAPGDRAWACGDDVNVNSGGNDRSISIECNPRQSDGDYDTIAQLIADLRATYGDLPLYPHRHWSSTGCPGTYDLARLDRLARTKSGKKPAASTPARPAANPAPARKDLDTVAREVIAGQWGNNPERAAKLRAAGYDADAVQARVNQMLGARPTPAPSVDIDALARAVIRGDYGNGDERRRRLGSNYDAVQRRVNQMLG
ncbi:N-acetylmuramoyl-L-alanine amidase [Bifidobacterium choerinum]|uniref:N-acetylmuramoyl-L-alanine amidase n=1 Tax=Bifidobacterium choerinum TaxID=35760 RepID=A0A2D3D4H4_9BIFI|nr:N-acetylmuramoyl-L-alanine amidase [Bifidobacterium choerinum]ATU19820.1 hypothetical protein BcFMB_01445 [Bifidobacterium choerinum]